MNETTEYLDPRAVELGLAQAAEEAGMTFDELLAAIKAGKVRVEVVKEKQP
jgi:hypothetical protein